MTHETVWLAIAVMALVTALLRFLPFAVFRGNRKPPRLVEKLGRLLPCATMGMLVVYCLKDVSFAAPAAWLPALLACITVSLLYLWKRNTLLSILAGTLCYMALVQLVF